MRKYGEKCRKHYKGMNMLSRRALLQIAAAAALTPTTRFDEPVLNLGRCYGWVDSETSRLQFKQRDLWAASDVDREIRGTGKDRIVRLWKIWEQVAGREFDPHKQTIGDCVSQAMALGLETQSAVSIVSGGDYEWQGKISTEALYIAARIEIAQGLFGMNDGCTGVHMVQAAERYGVLPCDYGQGFDVSKYNPTLAKQLAYSPKFQPGEGVPKWLEPKMAENKLRRGVLINGGFDQAADFVSNGYPILLCSNVGYKYRSDSQGFLGRSFFPWPHSMLLWGIDTRSRRQGGNIANSWDKDWYKQTALHKLGCPAGCFWADRKNINSMLARGDSYALVEYHGPQRRKLD